MRLCSKAVFITPLSFFVAGFISKRTFNLFKKQTEARSTQVSFINEMVSNQKIVRAFGKEEENIRFISRREVFQDRGFPGFVAGRGPVEDRITCF